MYIQYIKCTIFHRLTNPNSKTPCKKCFAYLCPLDFKSQDKIKMEQVDKYDAWPENRHAMLNIAALNLD